MDVSDFCAQSSVLVVAGKGGVGKTTVSAALARMAARNGVSVLLVETEKSSTEPAPIRARTLTAEGALVEYLTDHGFRRVAKHLAHSGLLEVMATAIPGLRDILVLGQIAQMERSGAAELIVVDGPASGHATTFLTSAQGLFDSSRTGPIRTLAAGVVEMLSDPARCRVVLVTLAEETPVNETAETAHKLEERVATHLGPIVVNGLYPRLDDLDTEPEAAAAWAGVTLRHGEADAMRAAAAFRRLRQEMQAEQVTRLAEALPLPQLWLPHLFTGDIGPAGIDRLVDDLETGLVHLDTPPGRPTWTHPAEMEEEGRVPAGAAAGKGPRT